MTAEQPPYSSFEEDAPGGVGCGGLVVIVVMSLLALTLPFWVGEFEAGRDQAVALMWKMVAPGIALGALLFIYEKRKLDRGTTGGWAGPSMGAFGLAGYVIAIQAGPRFLGGFVGLSSAGLVTFSLLSALWMWRRKRTG